MHMDEKICAGQSPSQLFPTAPSLGETALRYQGREISYEKLARWLRQLHRLAVNLAADVKVPSQPDADAD